MIPFLSFFGCPSAFGFLVCYGILVCRLLFSGKAFPISLAFSWSVAPAPAKCVVAVSAPPLGPSAPGGSCQQVLSYSFFQRWKVQSSLSLSARPGPDLRPTGPS